MLEIQRIRAEKDTLVKGLLKRNIQAESTLDEILAKDVDWRAAKTDLDNIAAEMNQLAIYSRRGNKQRQLH
jgi:seryl-tRNA synthetase